MKTLEFRDGSLWLIDQTQLPLTSVLIECRNHADVAQAIRILAVRGAPAIGLAAAYGVVLAANSLATSGASREAFLRGLNQASEELRVTRPTAVNLFWALERMRRLVAASETESTRAVADLLVEEADRMVAEDEQVNREMGAHGARLIPDGSNVLTHCNSGALAAGAFGTALGAIRSAHEEGKSLHVWVDETRPLLQGARLTAWELQEAGIPYTLITDSMAGHFMARGSIDLTMVGADRVAANGDVANKIGTYSAAVLAQFHKIPFYVVVPTSTLDLAIPSGDAIAIEERDAREIASFAGVQVAPDGATVANPAFDVTPAHLIAAIVTERGVIYPPFEDGLTRDSVDPVNSVDLLEPALARADGI